ncbi:hemerythrin domain-containing protein [Allopusillimonas ginsengisoli]|uniref:hemerythrin domain-containing protein n=1 Tax=Allopusillimonas ginsengisoli TaxID=453575 RepID=UPI001020CEBE|nr:hemerythrin domain-containing protein [Allopusillimonas ginsengisoli]TEA79854.1 hemerythrin domain-containing protein [Allopusillimonas ginsengisoli]
MNIFEALRESHEIQRTLALQLIKTSGDTPERSALFKDLRKELAAHALAEERHFYAPIMDSDMGIDVSRHAIAEHHEIDELIEQIEDTDASSPGWLRLAKQLSEKVHHHLKEEEQGFFQQAGKILSDKEKLSLVGPYLTDYEKALSEA